MAAVDATHAVTVVVLSEGATLAPVLVSAAATATPLKVVSPLPAAVKATLLQALAGQTTAAAAVAQWGLDGAALAAQLVERLTAFIAATTVIGGELPAAHVEALACRIAAYAAAHRAGEANPSLGLQCPEPWMQGGGTATKPGSLMAEFFCLPSVTDAIHSAISGASSARILLAGPAASAAPPTHRGLFASVQVPAESAWALGGLASVTTAAVAPCGTLTPLSRLARPAAWWESAAAELAALPSLPAYVYDEAMLAARVADLQAFVDAGAVSRLFYAIKANSNAEVLTALWRRGVCFEVVSMGEIDHVTALCPDAAAPGADRMLFTPNFAERGEYTAALARGLLVTVDNAFCLTEWGADFAGARIMLRIDPGVGKGHHAYVKTAGKVSKFGIPPERLEEVARVVAAHGIRVVGLHAHTGSGIDETDTWESNARLLIDLAGKWFPEARIVDVGGGISVPYREHETAVDLSAVRASLAAVKAAHPEFSLWMEPGRFFVAEAGVLVARVTQRKDKGGMLYVGVNAGMNALIRPALYGAYHQIASLSRGGERARFSVVGPICESGDTLGLGRELPAATAEGDVLCVACAGAYGYAMASDYNMRPKPVEILRRIVA